VGFACLVIRVGATKYDDFLGRDPRLFDEPRWLAMTNNVLPIWPKPQSRVLQVVYLLVGEIYRRVK
jgi:hypothetical protein